MFLWAILFCLCLAAVSPLFLVKMYLLLGHFCFLVLVYTDDPYLCLFIFFHSYGLELVAPLILTLLGLKVIFHFVFLTSKGYVIWVVFSVS